MPRAIASQFRWNARAGRYVDAAGRFVPRATVRKALDTVRRAAERDMGRAVTALQGNVALLSEFERAMRLGIKITHLASAMSAKGGWAQMTSADYGRVGQIVRFHYGRLERWLQQIADGEAPLDGRAVARARLYARASLGTHYEILRGVAEVAGEDVEQNVLGAADKHCATCQNMSALGWVAIGTLIPIGQRTCLGNCVCAIVFSRSSEIEV
jgi:hypothetical protein